MYLYQTTLPYTAFGYTGYKSQATTFAQTTQNSLGQVTAVITYASTAESWLSNTTYRTTRRTNYANDNFIPDYDEEYHTSYADTFLGYDHSFSYIYRATAYAGDYYTAIISNTASYFTEYQGTLRTNQSGGTTVITEINQFSSTTLYTTLTGSYTASATRTHSQLIPSTTSIASNIVTSTTAVGYYTISTTRFTFGAVRVWTSLKTYELITTGTSTKSIKASTNVSTSILTRYQRGLVFESAPNWTYGNALCLLSKTANLSKLFYSNFQKITSPTTITEVFQGAKTTTIFPSVATQVSSSLYDSLSISFVSDSSWNVTYDESTENTTYQFSSTKVGSGTQEIYYTSTSVFFNFNYSSLTTNEPVGESSGYSYAGIGSFYSIANTTSLVFLGPQQLSSTFENFGGPASFLTSSTRLWAQDIVQTIDSLFTASSPFESYSTSVKITGYGQSEQLKYDSSTWFYIEPIQFLGKSKTFIEKQNCSSYQAEIVYIPASQDKSVNTGYVEFTSPAGLDIAINLSQIKTSYAYRPYGGIFNNFRTEGNYGYEHFNIGKHLFNNPYYPIDFPQEGRAVFPINQSSYIYTKSGYNVSAGRFVTTFVTISYVSGEEYLYTSQSTNSTRTESSFLLEYATPAGTKNVIYTEKYLLGYGHGGTITQKWVPTIGGGHVSLYGESASVFHMQTTAYASPVYLFNGQTIETGQYYNTQKFTKITDASGGTSSGTICISNSFSVETLSYPVAYENLNDGYYLKGISLLPTPYREPVFIKAVDVGDGFLWMSRPYPFAGHVNTFEWTQDDRSSFELNTKSYYP